METHGRESTTLTCIICEQDRLEGITICEQFICSECETEIVKTDVRDAKYPFFISQMKRIWYKQNA
ncbi:sigma factor G inhibitor Gin [Paenibacillus thermotolerans]|uniref:sigma factor G inhibitor Gin n=1 Tax=Paenibacillus thermotolerans TaxID=3027807 RepID=UPI00236848F8|nr:MULTISPECIES: sigma factor G inhibitor Gin [unclassified Paenibacillus]